MYRKFWFIGVWTIAAWTAYMPAAVAQHSHAHPVTDSQLIEAPFQAKMSVPDGITPGRSFRATISIRDDKGNPVRDFDTFQEKLMHLILVRDDLEFFSHLHPEYDGKGNFQIETSVPSPGNYTFFCDYQPAGAKERISVLKLGVMGKVPSSARPNVGVTRKTIGGTKIEMSSSPNIAKANEDIAIAFDLKQTANDLPVQGLRLYLGEKGHLVIIKSSTSLEAGNYIHAHATREDGTSQIRFMTRFPETGLYKLWCQFDLNGNIHTADFWINVE